MICIYNYTYIYIYICSSRNSPGCTTKQDAVLKKRVTWGCIPLGKWLRPPIIYVIYCNIPFYKWDYHGLEDYKARILRNLGWIIWINILIFEYYL